MVESVTAFTGCSRNGAFASLMQCDGDMARACEKARKCVSPGRLAALGGEKLVTPYINVEFEAGGKSSLLLDSGNSAAFVVTEALYRKYLAHLPLATPSSRRMDTAGASPLTVIGEVTFDAFVFFFFNRSLT